MAASDATAVPVKNQAYRVTFPILDADGDLVPGATGLDSEISKDAGTFTDCTNEATEIASSSGMYYLDLSSTEMNADTVAILVKTSSSGAKTTPIVLYPQESGDIKVDLQSIGGTLLSGNGPIPELGIMRRGTAQSATATGIVLDSGAAFADNTLVGATVWAYGSTQGYWQCRVITANLLSGDACTVETWPVTPSGTITYILFGSAPSVSTAVTNVNVTQISGDSTAADNLEAMLDGTGATLTATFTGNLTGNVGGNVTGTVGGLTNSGIDALYTRALTESYAADGSPPTVAQALFAIQQFLQEKAASGTALTVKRLDGSTTAMTFLLDDGTTPTSITRTS